MIETIATRESSPVQRLQAARFLPTDAWLRWLLVPALAFVALATSTTWLADFWHHLARGRAIVTSGRLLDHDIYTFTVSGAAFQDVNWLTQVVYYLLYQTGGLGLVRLVNAAVVALTLLWLVAFCRRVSGSLTVALGVGIIVFLGLWHILTIRPQTFSLLLFVALYDLLERSRHRPGLAWLAAPILALWANLHGAFPAGIMLVGCYGAEALWQWRRAMVAARLQTCPEKPDTLANASPQRRALLFLAVGGAAVAATLLNPYGWNIYAYVGQTSHLASARGIDEWLPPSYDQLIGIAFYASLPLFALVCGWAWRHHGERLAAREWLLLACFLPLALGSVRMVAWWFLVIAPPAARRLTLLWPRAKDGGRAAPNLGAAVSCAALVALMVLSLPGLQRYNPLLALRPADHTLEHLQETLGALESDRGNGNVFTRFEWGEYLAWAAHPDFRVFMDGRIEIYPDAVWNAYADITQGRPGWDRLLDDYSVDALILDAGYHARTGLYAAAEQSPRWRRAHQAGDAALFVRR
jgi:hypothetical protein